MNESSSSSSSVVSLPNIKSLETILAEIKKEYDKDKKDWRIISGGDSLSLDSFILQHDRAWQLKMDFIRPFEVMGLGSKITKIDEKIQQKVRNNGMPFLFEMLVPQPKDQWLVARGLSSHVDQQNLVKLKKSVTKGFGPIDLELRKELDRLIDKKFPMKRKQYL